eukprot:3795422-Prymnesium_polylepis.2
MQKRKLRKRAAGSTDEESIWAKQSSAGAVQAARAAAGSGCKAALRGRTTGLRPCADRLVGRGEHHEKCTTGCVSPFDYPLPLPRRPGASEGGR